MKFILDFSTPDRLPRRLVFGEPLEVVRADSVDAVRPALRRVAEATQRGLHAVGYVAYEAAPAFDRAARVRSGCSVPLVWFGLHHAPVDCGPDAPAPFEVPAWELDTGRDEYGQAIDAIHAAIRRGDAYQMNYTVRAHAHFSGDAQSYYEQLRQAQQAEFCAYADIGTHRILSASPELFFAWQDGVLTTRPMKGTARRGQLPEEDAELARWLRDSEKNRAENLMIVDLLRNDLSRLSMPGGVQVPHLFSIENYPTVLQMTSTITARTRPEVTLDDVFAALFPCGSITGAPKLKSMDIIADLEKSPRAVYCGAIGHVAPGGAARFNVAIRTVTLDAASGRMECGLGGGITWDSVAADEYAEVQTKSRFLTRAGNGFELFETLLLVDGRYELLDRHLARLTASARHFGFATPQDAAAVLAAHAAAHPQGRLRVRLLCAADGHLRVESGAAGEPDNSPRKVRLASAPVSRAEPLLYHKTTRRGIYDAHLSQVAGSAFDVLLWNDAGELTEFTRGNLVLDIDGSLYTPPVSSGLLDGTLRRELVERGELMERVLTREDLGRAQSVWFINSVRGWIPVTIDNAPLDTAPAVVPAYADPYAGHRDAG
ncbi:MAG: aminodeoxychorismate synthase component I [Methyloversatilis discipulorum]|uniref:aminodeoxychorismate synthase component I n=1 Tax=Methyloversatilis discipulorum TaxID=1119528 RepID=UPI0026EA2C94|nr:aminodeoxychorismate synthase component I [Methyloversatilis discipulorum]MBT9515941.1 aminodeoxychorismate synthase component I [Methyloversatilis discipulorum]